MNEKQELRLKVWNALHTYYWDAKKLRQWYLRLSSARPGDVSDIEKGMKKYPDLTH